jgi:NAD(P)H-nitrite reductase large subunit
VPRIVIVGNSAASLTALETIRKLDRGSPVTLVSDEGIPAYSRVMLPYLVSGERSDLSLRPPGYAEGLGARLLLGRRALQAQDGTLALDDGTTLPYDRLLIATGSRAAIPDIEGVRSPGVTPLKNMSDALAIRDRLAGARHAVIIGGGLICLLMVRAFLKLGVALTIVVSSDRLLSRMLDGPGAEIVERRLREAGVRVITRTDVARIVERGGRLRSVVTSPSEELPTDIAILAKGVRSNIEVASASGLATDRGILVDQYARTSRPGIFAAGDCAEAPDGIVRGKRTICATWFEAVAQGEIAAANMLLDMPRPTFGALKMNVMETLGIAVASIGLIEPPDGSARVYAGAANGSYRKLIVSNDRLVGAVLVGDVSEAGTLAMLVRRRRRISEFKRLDPARPIRHAELAVQWGRGARVPA